jgi:hypothetical protein
LGRLGAARSGLFSLSAEARLEDAILARSARRSRSIAGVQRRSRLHVRGSGYRFCICICRDSPFGTRRVGGFRFGCGVRSTCAEGQRADGEERGKDIESRVRHSVSSFGRSLAPRSAHHERREASPRMFNKPPAGPSAHSFFPCSAKEFELPNCDINTSSSHGARTERCPSSDPHRIARAWGSCI